MWGNLQHRFKGNCLHFISHKDSYLRIFSCLGSEFELNSTVLIQFGLISMENNKKSRDKNFKNSVTQKETMKWNECNVGIAPYLKWAIVSVIVLSYEQQRFYNSYTHKWAKHIPIIIMKSLLDSVIAPMKWFPNLFPSYDIF